MDHKGIPSRRKKCGKYSRLWLAVFGIMSLGMFPVAMSDDFDCDFDNDGDCDCDSDGDGRCDYGHDHDFGDRVCRWVEGAVDRKIKEMADQIAQGEWEDYDDDSEQKINKRELPSEESVKKKGKTSRAERRKKEKSWEEFRRLHVSEEPPCVIGLQRLPKSEVNRIRRKAFLLKRKNIAVGHNTEDLLEKNVETVDILLYNQAFKNIRRIPLKIIGPDSVWTVGTVQAVEIGETTNFQALDLFPYDIDVKIYHREKKEVVVPFSGKSLRKQEYTEVCEKLESMGFSNVERRQRRSIFVHLMKNHGAIRKVYINEDSAFREGDVFKFDARVVVEYHAGLFSK